MTTTTNIMPSLFTDLQTSYDMQNFGDAFITKFPMHIKNLKIHGRKITDSERKGFIFSTVDDIDSIQKIMKEVIDHPITQQAQFIKQKLLRIAPTLAMDEKSLRNAKGYILAHSSEVENKHGLHALAAAYSYSRLKNIPFNIEELRQVMLNYNDRVGQAFHALNEALIA